MKKLDKKDLRCEFINCEDEWTRRLVWEITVDKKKKKIDLYMCKKHERQFKRMKDK